MDWLSLPQLSESRRAKYSKQMRNVDNLGANI